MHYALSLFPGLLTPRRGEGSDACGGHAGVGRGTRAPGVGHRTALAQEGTLWGQMRVGEPRVVFADRWRVRKAKMLSDGYMGSRRTRSDGISSKARLWSSSEALLAWLPSCIAGRRLRQFLDSTSVTQQRRGTAPAARWGSRTCHESLMAF